MGTGISPTTFRMTERDGKKGRRVRSSREVERVEEAKLTRVDRSVDSESLSDDRIHNSKL